MNYIKGFAEINKNATTCRGAQTPEDFIGKILRVTDFAEDGGVLVFNPQGTALAMFDKIDVYRSFKCDYINGIIIPPNLDYFNQMAYVAKATTRKGGYNDILSRMVMAASLAKGEFYDHFLWAKQ